MAAELSSLPVGSAPYPIGKKILPLFCQHFQRTVKCSRMEGKALPYPRGNRPLLSRMDVDPTFTCDGEGNGLRGRMRFSGMEDNKLKKEESFVYSFCFSILTLGGEVGGGGIGDDVDGIFV